MDDRFQEIAAFMPQEAERTDFEQYYSGKVDIGRCSFRKKPLLEQFVDKGSL